MYAWVCVCVGFSWRKGGVTGETFMTMSSSMEAPGTWYMILFQYNSGVRISSYLPSSRISLALTCYILTLAWVLPRFPQSLFACSDFLFLGDISHEAQPLPWPRFPRPRSLDPYDKGIELYYRRMSTLDVTSLIRKVWDLESKGPLWKSFQFLSLVLSSRIMGREMGTILHHPEGSITCSSGTVAPYPKEPKRI